MKHSEIKTVHAIIYLEVPEYQIGQEVSIYFKDTMCVNSICKSLNKGQACLESMSREEVIKDLTKLIQYGGLVGITCHEALKIAIKALEQEPILDKIDFHCRPMCICNIKRNAELIADILNGDSDNSCAYSYDVYPYAKYKVIKAESEDKIK